MSIAEAFEQEEEEGIGRAPFREEEEEEEEEVEEEDDDNDEEEEEEEEEEEPERHRRRSSPPTKEDDELAALDAEYAAADAAALGSREALREAAARDARKGAAVAAQRAAWDRALEARIMLQRALGGCNRLPRPETMALVARLGGEGGGEEKGSDPSSSSSSSSVSELRVAAAGVAREAAALAVRLAEAADVLSARAAGREAGRKRKQGGGGGSDEEGEEEEESETEDDDNDNDNDNDNDDNDDNDLDLNPETAALWRRLERSLRSFEPIRDAAFDRWHRKAALLAGGGAALRGGLRVLDQPPSRQVAAAMASSFGSGSTRNFTSKAAGGESENRLLSWSRLLRSDAPKRLGEPSVVAKKAEKEKKKQRSSSSSSSDSDDASSSSSSSGEEEEQDPAFFASDARDRDTYDDGEFYSQLLKEFVEANATGGSELAATNNNRANSSSVKRRKVVDRRASKGRKLRFDVQEKLVGFMAPVEEEGEEPTLARQLAGCLFGVVRSSSKKKGGSSKR